jgi:hypothetical protein
LSYEVLHRLELELFSFLLSSKKVSLPVNAHLLFRVASNHPALIHECNRAIVTEITLGESLILFTKLRSVANIIRVVLSACEWVNLSNDSSEDNLSLTVARDLTDILLAEVLLGKSKGFLGDFVFLVEIVKFYAFVASADFFAWVLLIGVVEEDNLVELNAMHLELLNVVLSLGESK